VEITIPRLSDMHAHLREGDLQRTILPFHDAHTTHIVAMPNTKEPLRTVNQVVEYRRALDIFANNLSAKVPLYLTGTTTVDDIQKAVLAKIVSCKVYPIGVTTNSDAGIKFDESSLDLLNDVFLSMSANGVILSIHAELPGVNVLNAERAAMKYLTSLKDRFPLLRIIVEHVSTIEAVTWVIDHDLVAGTITPQHMMLTFNDLFNGGMRPKYFCKPIVKTEADRVAIVTAATSGNPKFFLGSDSAPHINANKYKDGGAAGVFNAPHLPGLLARVFDDMNALDKLADFACNFGPDFYGLQRPRKKLVLTDDRSQITTVESPIDFLACDSWGIRK